MNKNDLKTFEKVMSLTLALKILKEIEASNLLSNDPKMFQIDLGKHTKYQHFLNENFILSLIKLSKPILGYQITSNELVVTSVKSIPSFGKKIDSSNLGQYENKSSGSGFVHFRNNIGSVDLPETLVFFIVNDDYPDAQSLKDINKITLKGLCNFFASSLKDKTFFRNYITDNQLFTDEILSFLENVIPAMFDVIGWNLYEIWDYCISLAEKFDQEGDLEGANNELLPVIGLFKQNSSLGHDTSTLVSNNGQIKRAAVLSFKDKLLQNYNLARGLSPDGQLIDIRKIDEENREIAKRILDLKSFSRLSEFYFEEALILLNLKKEKVISAKTKNIKNFQEFEKVIKDLKPMIAEEINNIFIDSDFRFAIQSLEEEQGQINNDIIAQIESLKKTIMNKDDSQIPREKKRSIDKYLDKIISVNNKMGSRLDFSDYRISIINKITNDLCGGQKKYVSSVKISFCIHSSEEDDDSVLYENIKHLNIFHIFPVLSQSLEVFSATEDGPLYTSDYDLNFTGSSKGQRYVDAKFSIEVQGSSVPYEFEIFFSKNDLSLIAFERLYVLQLKNWIPSSSFREVFIPERDVENNFPIPSSERLKFHPVVTWSGIQDFEKILKNIKSKVLDFIQLQDSFMHEESGRWNSNLKSYINSLTDLESEYLNIFNLMINARFQLQLQLASVAPQILTMFSFFTNNKGEIDLTLLNPMMIHSRLIELRGIKAYVKNCVNKTIYDSLFISSRNKKDEIRDAIINSSTPSYVFLNKQDVLLPTDFHFSNAKMVKAKPKKTSNDDQSDIKDSFLDNVNHLLKYFVSLHSYSKDSLDIIFVNVEDYKLVSTAMKQFNDSYKTEDTSKVLINSYVTFNSPEKQTSFRNLLVRDLAEDNRLQTSFRNLPIQSVNFGTSVLTNKTENFKSFNKVKYLTNKNMAILFKPSSNCEVSYQFYDLNFEESIITSSRGTHLKKIPFSTTNYNRLEEFLNAGEHSEFINKYYFLSYLVHNDGGSGIRDIQYQKCKKSYQLQEGLKQYIQMKDQFYWVCIFDDIFNKQIVLNALPSDETFDNQSGDIRTIIKYESGEVTDHPLNLAVVTSRSMDHLDEILHKRLEDADLNLNIEDIKALKREANALSGDIVLKSTGLGQHSKELFGIVLTKNLIERSSPFNNRTGPSGWIYLDDYKEWFNDKIRPDLFYYSFYRKDDVVQLDILCLEVKFYQRIDNDVLNKAEKQTVSGVTFLSKLFDDKKRFKDQKIMIERFINALAENLKSEFTTREYEEYIQEFLNRCNSFFQDNGKLPTVNIYGVITAYSYLDNESDSSVEELLEDGRSFVMDHQGNHLIGGIYKFVFSKTQIKSLFNFVLKDTGSTKFDFQKLNTLKLRDEAYTSESDIEEDLGVI